jgi:hypothetical protein
MYGWIGNPDVSVQHHAETDASDGVCGPLKRDDDGDNHNDDKDKNNANQLTRQPHG